MPMLIQEFSSLRNLLLLHSSLSEQALHMHLDANITNQDILQNPFNTYREDPSIFLLLFRNAIHFPRRSPKVTHTFIALDKDVLVGLGLTYRSYSTTHLGIFVKKGYRRQGIGTSLCKALIQKEPTAINHPHNRPSKLFFNKVIK